MFKQIYYNDSGHGQGGSNGGFSFYLDHLYNLEYRLTVRGAFQYLDTFLKIKLQEADLYILIKTFLRLKDQYDAQNFDNFSRVTVASSNLILLPDPDCLLIEILSDSSSLFFDLRSLSPNDKALWDLALGFFKELLQNPQTDKVIIKELKNIFVKYLTSKNEYERTEIKQLLGEIK